MIMSFNGIGAQHLSWARFKSKAIELELEERRAGHTGHLHVGGVVGNVHEGGVDHLVVDGVLGGVTHATGSGIQVVDEHAAHLALLDDVGGLTVTLTDELGGLTSISGLELTSGHDDGVDAQLLVGQSALEGLTLSLASPDTQNQGHLHPDVCRLS